MRTKIAIFDSGVGGLTLLKTCLQQLQGIDFLYLADKGNMPYGNKSAEQIYNSTYQALQILKEYKIDALVLACNTATAICIEKLRAEKTLQCKIFGVEPAILPALQTIQKGCTFEHIASTKKNLSTTKDISDSKSILQEKGKVSIFLEQKKDILLLATEATLKSERVQNLLQKSGGKEKIYCYASKALATEIEKNIFQLNDILWSNYLPKGDFCGVVLGCTHYIHIQKYIQKQYKCMCFDGNLGTVNHIQTFLLQTPYFVENSPNTVQFIGKNADFYQKVFQNIV